ncbi:NAD(P)/FAD-dependent oxidoreductase [bacterium]|nr:MAG: NAD(P)/FAD-dependent oxidoreductase [bacterium]
MQRLLILGAGISGHTAALHAWKKLKGTHEVMVVSPNKNWNWIPSNIWVGVGFMEPKQVTFDLEKVYYKEGIHYRQAKALEIYPEGNSEHKKPCVLIEYTSEGRRGQQEFVEYDYLINSTGPKLNFNATPGLGPEHHSYSVCTYGHADETWKALQILINEMRHGQKKRIVIGTGHGTCTCQGAAFEYLFNVEYILKKEGVRHMAELYWISNEAELGDFGMGGMHIKMGGYVTHSKIFTESLYAERGIKWITQAAVKEVRDKELTYEDLDGVMHELDFDFAMLLPPFSGVGLTAKNKAGADITSELFAANGFMKVDGDYTPKEYDNWSPEDWPKSYKHPKYDNVYAIGIAFAPPHSISKPMKSKSGTPIFPTPPRTGMPSGVMAREIAFNICDRMLGNPEKATRTASMAKMGAACIASAGAGVLDGTAVSMTVYPIVPDFETFEETGRDLNFTTGEIGLAGHWIKHLLHHGFIYKAKAKPFWRLIPE